MSIIAKTFGLAIVGIIALVVYQPLQVAAMGHSCARGLSDDFMVMRRAFIRSEPAGKAG